MRLRDRPLACIERCVAKLYYRVKERNKTKHSIKNTSRKRGVFALWYNLYMEVSNKKRVGIIRGGSGKHYDASLKKGGEIILHIHENLRERWKPVDILVDRDHIWHLGGVPVAPSDLVHKIDVAWNTSHPSFARILESLAIPAVGTGSFSHSLEQSAEMLREHMRKINVAMPRSILLPLYQADIDGPLEKYAQKKAREVFGKFASPWIVRSYAATENSPSNTGIHLAKTFPELVRAIEDAALGERSILVQEFITGKIGSVHSVPGFRGQAMYTFPLGTSFGSFNAPEKEEIVNLAKSLHGHVGAGHYLKCDFVLHPRGKVYLLSIDSTPNLSPDSHFSQVCESVGAKPHQVIEHMLEQALK